MSIRERIGKFLLLRKPPLFSQREYLGWEDVESFLVCGQMTKVWDERSWYSVRRKLRDMGKDVDVVVFDPNLKEDSTHTTIFNRFGKKALDFFGLPKKELASRYQRKKYDIILIIADQPCMPIQFIASRAKGKFRVGCFKDITADLDLILIRSSEMGSKEYLNELIKYLQQINSK